MKRRSRYLVVVGVTLSAVAVSFELYARLKHGESLTFAAHQLSFRQADAELRHGRIPHARGLSVTSEWRVEYRINSLS